MRSNFKYIPEYDLEEANHFLLCHLPRRILLAHGKCSMCSHKYAEYTRYTSIWREHVKACLHSVEELSLLSALLEAVQKMLS